MKIRVCFWSGVGGQSPTLGNVRGFQQFGDVQYIPCVKVRKQHLQKGADLLFTPDIALLKGQDPEIFTILQLGGRGSDEHWRVGAFDDLHKITDHAEVVTMLDTNMYHFLLTKDQPWNWKKMFLVPNGLHYDMFKPKKRKNRVFTVLMGKIGGVGKVGYDVVKVANRLNKLGYDGLIQLVAPVQSSFLASQNWIPLNPGAFYKMPQLYQEADVFLNVPEREVLPNMIFEAFLTGLPVVVSAGTSIARLQTIPENLVHKMVKDFGTTVDYFDETWSPHYETGEHYLQGGTIDEIAQHIIDLYEDPILRRKLGARGRKWALTLNWTFYRKCKLLMQLAEQAGFKV